MGRIAPVALVALAAALVGCGSEPERSFKAAAATVCRRYNAEIDRLPPPRGTVAEQAATAHRINLLTLREFDELRRLPASAEERRTFAAIIDEGERAVREADRSTKLIATDPAAATRATTAAVRRLAVVNRRLDQHGLHACAS